MNRRTLLAALGAGAVLLAAAPRPAEALHTLAGGTPAASPTAPLVATVALLSWGLVGWLLATALLTAGSCLRGPVGSACARALQRAAPAALRRAVAVALGVGVVLGAAAPARAVSTPVTPVSAATSMSAAAPAAAELPSLDVPSLDWPSLAGPAPAAAPALPAGGTVIVAPGDSLWRIAAEHLPERASAADIAVAWPAWWSANRAVVGDDPDLLQPGEQLVAPSDPSGRQ